MRRVAALFFVDKLDQEDAIAIAVLRDLHEVFDILEARTARELVGDGAALDFGDRRDLHMAHAERRARTDFDALIFPDPHRAIDRARSNARMQMLGEADAHARRLAHRPRPRAALALAMPPDVPKPHYDTAHALRWQDADAARSYKSRPPYAPAMYDFLRTLITDAPTRVLDIGCGTGKVARGLAHLVDHIDAIDIAAEMIAEAKLLPGGDAPNITWRVGSGETAPLDAPYALIVGGESLHWMEWGVILPRFARALTPNGMLACVRPVDEAPAIWRDGLKDIIKRHSTMQGWVPHDMLKAWDEAGLYQPIGEHVTAPVEFVQTVEEYIDAFHAMSTLTRAHIDAAAFDAEVRALLAPHYPDGVIRREVAAHIAWGRPLDPG